MKRSLADTSTRSTAGTIHSSVLYHSYLIMLIYIHTYTHTCSSHTGYTVFSPAPHFLSGLGVGYLFYCSTGQDFDWSQVTDH